MGKPIESIDFTHQAELRGKINGLLAEKVSNGYSSMSQSMKIVREEDPFENGE